MKNKSILVLNILIFLTLGLTAQDIDYGLNEANTKYLSKRGVLGGRTDYDYLGLKNHSDVSGVPLGGIGVGNINLSPSGAFTRIGINNIHNPIKRSENSFFALWTKTGTETNAVRLVRDNSLKYGMKGVENTQYTGLFPTAEVNYEENGLIAKPTIRAFSSLVPQDTKNSSLPVVWFEVDLESKVDAEVSVAFSWEDFIGLYNDPKSLEGINDQQLLTGGKLENVNGEIWPLKNKAKTSAKAYNTQGGKGVKQFADNVLNPIKLTFQNYVDNVVLLAEQAKGQSISILSAYDIENGATEWNEFVKNGEFTSLSAIENLSSEGGKSNASVVAIKTKLKKGEKKTVKFTLSWWAPEISIDKKSAPLGYYWPSGGDYNKYYHNYFRSIDEVIEYAQKNKNSLFKKTIEWHTPIMSSSLPDWYKLKLINSGYVIYTNLILNKKGDMTVNEGAMGGFAGTMDQRLSAHPFYQKFFTELDRSEMNIFADATDPVENYILHFIGHYYVGMGTVGGKVPTEKGYMLDNSSGWLIQLIKDYEQTGDIEYLMAHIDKVRKVMVFLDSRKPKGSNIPIGATTYDDFSHPPLYSYYAGVWLTTLKAYEAIGKAIKDDEIVDFAQKEFGTAQDEIIKKLWNGRFFAYGSEPDGSKRLDSVLFTGQLAGQFLSRYCGWGDIYPMDIVKASLVSQFKISLSQTPDFYANKVWDINLGRGIDNRGSQCWPFYLESYTGFTAMQAGFYKDAMELMKHIQLVHLRNGWTWTQNLWNPSDVTYMTAPVTWFSTDVLAGAGLNVPREELRLSPIIEGREEVILPLFYPKFWATVTANPQNKTITMRVTKTFGKEAIRISKIISEPAGLASSERKEISIKPFIVKAGQTLNLSEYWDQIVRSETESVLLNADSHPFRYVNK